MWLMRAPSAILVTAQLKKGARLECNSHEHGHELYKRLCTAFASRIRLELIILNPADVNTSIRELAQGPAIVQWLATFQRLSIEHARYLYSIIDIKS